MRIGTGRSYWTLRTRISLRSSRTCGASSTCWSSYTLWTGIALRACGACCSYITLWTLRTCCAGRTGRASRTYRTSGSYIALRALRTCCPGGAGRTGRTSSTLVAFTAIDGVKCIRNAYQFGRTEGYKVCTAYGVGLYLKIDITGTPIDSGYAAGSAGSAGAADNYGKQAGIVSGHFSCFRIDRCAGRAAAEQCQPEVDVGIGNKLSEGVAGNRLVVEFIGYLGKRCHGQGEQHGDE